MCAQSYPTLCDPCGLQHLLKFLHYFLKFAQLMSTESVMLSQDSWKTVSCIHWITYKVDSKHALTSYIIPFVKFLTDGMILSLLPLFCLLSPHLLTVSCFLQFFLMFLSYHFSPGNYWIIIPYLYLLGTGQLPKYFAHIDSVYLFIFGCALSLLLHTGFL